MSGAGDRSTGLVIKSPEMSLRGSNVGGAQMLSLEEVKLARRLWNSMEVQQPRWLASALKTHFLPSL